MISSRSLMVNGQDKLVQGGEGEKGRGGGGERDEGFENVWEVASPSPELVSSILRTIFFFFFLLLLSLLLFCFILFIITFLFFHKFYSPYGLLSLSSFFWP